MLAFLPGHLYELRMRFKAEDLVRFLCVERKIHSRTDSSLRHAPRGLCQHSLTIGSQPPVGNRQIHKLRHNAALVEPNGILRVRPSEVEGRSQ